MKSLVWGTFAFLACTSGAKLAIGQQPAAQSAISTATESDATSWNQWRGAARSSVVAGAWPAKLDADTLQKDWSVKFGESYSGPIISGDLVITTETKDKKFEIVTALNKHTGEKVWSTQWQGSMTVPFFAAKNGSWIRSTPATDGEHVYVAGIKGLLVCLKLSNGDVVWKVDLNQRYGVSRESFGHVCSPMIIKEEMAPTIYVQCSAGFVKMNRKTGEEIWRTKLGSGNMMSGGAFSSPILATLGNERQIVIQTRQELAGIEINSGNVLWRQPIPAFRGMNILTPTIEGNTVFTSSYNNKSLAFEYSKSGTQAKLTQKWESPLRAYMSSPVVIDGHAYVHLQNRQVACFDLSSGETKWVSKSRKRFGDYWSMIGCGDRILALDSSGILYLIAANPEKFEILGQVKLESNNTWAHLAIEKNRVYVRGLKSLTAYDWK